MKYKFTDTELKKVMSNLTLLIDTREQANEHVIEFLEKKKIPYRVEKIDMGDYGCCLPAGSIEGQVKDIYFTNDIVIERKNGIDEVAGNLKEDAARLNTELAHLNKYEIKYYVFLEDQQFDLNIRKGNYRSEYNPKALYARLKTIEARYNTIIRPIDKQYMGSEIYNTFYYYVREILKNRGYIEEGANG